jgi:hypothetical protein
MSDLKQQRIVAYKNASLEMQELYGDLKLGETLIHIMGQLKIPEEKQYEFINIIGDAILGLYPKEDISELYSLQLNKNTEKAIDVVRQLQPFITQIKVLPGIPNADKNLKERLELKPAQNQNALGGSKPLSREDVLKALTPTRTMAQDINSIKNKDAGSHS